MTQQKIKSNGYGSFIQEIIFKVDISVVDAAKRELDDEPFKIDDTHAYFKIYRNDRKRGDDEGIVFDLWSEFSFDNKHWSIDWENSVY